MAVNRKHAGTSPKAEKVGREPFIRPYVPCVLCFEYYAVSDCRTTEGF